MARMKHGPYGPIVGKIGGTVGYIRLGQPILRVLKHATNKPPTKGQLAARAKIGLVSGFVASINEFTNISFKPKSRQTIGKTAQNMAVSANMASAVMGEYPDFQLDGTKLVISEGKLALPPNCAVELEGETLRFSWQGGNLVGFPYSTEQVMMLAYFPESKRSMAIAGGARRTAEQDFLPLGRSDDREIPETCVDTYIAFVSNDRESVSNGLYLGRIELDPVPAHA
ncbi:MAG: DUF6266 family protein [Bacteroidota bacterium]